MQNNDNTPRRKLADILDGDGDADSLRQQWNSTEAAQDFAPLPAGAYECHVHSVELFNARTGTAGVKMQFRVADGEYTGRMLFHDCWLTPAALPQTKRDCTKLGLDSLDKLETANVEPGRIRCKVRVVLRRDDDGTERNRVRGFDVIRVDEPEADAFAPEDDAPADEPPEPASESADPAGDNSSPQREYDPDADGDASFDPAQLESKAAAENASTERAAAPSATGAAGDDGKPADPAALSRR